MLTHTVHHGAASRLYLHWADARMRGVSVYSVFRVARDRSLAEAVSFSRSIFFSRVSCFHGNARAPVWPLFLRVADFLKLIRCYSAIVLWFFPGSALEVRAF